MFLVSDYRNELYYRKLMVDLCLQHGVDDVKSFGIGAWLTAICRRYGVCCRDKGQFISPLINKFFKIFACFILGLLMVPLLILSTLHVLRYVNWLKPSLNVSGYTSLFLSHDKSGESKVLASKYMDGSLCVLHDSFSKCLTNSDMSLFSAFNLLQRVFHLPLLLPLLIIRDFLSCLVMLPLERKGEITDVFYLIDFALRIPHKCLFEITLSFLLKNNRFSEVITTNKEDRFAMLESRLCRGFDIPLICIPHGIEYEIDFPTGLAGDTFYCTSEIAKQVLSKQYDGRNNFVYDQTFQDQIYSKHSTSQRFRRIILFTEPRAPDVNLAICRFLLDSDVKFYIKIHPSENKEFYSAAFKDLKFEDSYDSAICGNVCLARTSSILIEALHNRSLAVSVIMNDYDSFVVDNLLPSLRRPDVQRADGLLALGELLATIDLEYSGG